jgi:hypothetical protein
MLWFFRHSQRRDILGVPVAVSGSDDEANGAFARIGGALELLRNYGKRALSDLRRDTDGIFVWATAGVLEWHREARPSIQLERSTAWLSHSRRPF